MRVAHLMKTSASMQRSTKNLQNFKGVRTLLLWISQFLVETGFHLYTPMRIAHEHSSEIHAYTHTDVKRGQTRGHTHTHTHTLMDTHTYTYIHTYTQTRGYIQTQTYTRRQIQEHTHTCGRTQSHTEKVCTLEYAYISRSTDLMDTRVEFLHSTFKSTKRSKVSLVFQRKL